MVMLNDNVPDEPGVYWYTPAHADKCTVVEIYKGIDGLWAHGASLVERPIGEMPGEWGPPCRLSDAKLRVRVATRLAELRDIDDRHELEEGTTSKLLLDLRIDELQRLLRDEEEGTDGQAQSWMVR